MPIRALAVSLLSAVPLAAGPAGPAAQARLKAADGREVGTALFTPGKGGVKVALEVTGLPPGKHGVHVHAAGQCEPPEFTSAGAHFDPHGKQHGLRNPQGAHAGDLPNLTVRKDGTGRLTFVLKGTTLGEGQGSLLGPDGTAIVVHASADDEKSNPAGNSGARIACGVIERQ